MKLRIVVQRYGLEIGGGAELHARYVAERLSRHADVHVLTTCARDYLTWRNELPPGPASVNGIRVERFPVAHERDLLTFAQLSTMVFDRRHSWQDEIAWLRSEGPACPDLIQRLQRTSGEFDYTLFFSARYYHAYHGARAVPGTAILVPTAEREPSLALAVLRWLCRNVRAIMYNSLEERALIQALSANDHVPGVVVGIGSEIPAQTNPERFRQTFGVHQPFILYLGRIDANKGCADLFRYFRAYTRNARNPPILVLAGTRAMEIPDSPDIRHVGFLGDLDKFDAIAAAEAVVMPSYYESLSMALLETWALGRPSLVNAECDVLLGQTLRSNAGLYYSNGAEFCAALDSLLNDAALCRTLGQRGREYYLEHYDWGVIERKYLEMFELLRSEPAPREEPIPGWLSKRGRRVPPANELLAGVPSGPVMALSAAAS